MSGSLPDTGWQVAGLFLLLDHWVQLLLLRGHQEEEALATTRKKKSPSTLRRDARRREQFLRKKFDAPNAASSSHSEQAEAPVLKTPEKERLPPPISDRSLTPVLGEGREEPPSSASTPVAV